ncbi:MAG: peptidase family M48-domain-containing protein [Piptocephalis tieghemiana]|nr:MAG: peptidase family M48-domain-containing protein [Piptocephalis tieghemiana]
MFRARPARTWASERPATLLDKYGREIQRLDNSSSSSGKYRRFGEGRDGGGGGGGHRGRRRFDPTLRFYIWAGTGVCLAGGYYVTHLDTVPITGRRRFIDVSPDMEKQVAQAAYQSVMQEWQHRILPAHHPVSQSVRRVAERIIQVSGMKGLEWEVFVVHSDQANAFVIPGGKIFVFTGILPLAQNDDGLAAVLGHEKIAHQLAQHHLENLSFSRLIMLGQLIFSVATGTSLTWNSMFSSLSEDVKQKRTMLKLMSQACFDPNAAVSMWKRMSVYGGQQPASFLSTHPSNKNRIEKIREWMPEAMQVQEDSNCHSDAWDFSNMMAQRRWPHIST